MGTAAREDAGAEADLLVSDVRQRSASSPGEPHFRGYVHRLGRAVLAQPAAQVEIAVMPKSEIVKFRRLLTLPHLAIGIALFVLAEDRAFAEPRAYPEAFVECRVGGRLVMKRARECVGRNSVVREVGVEKRAEASIGWAAINADEGVALQPFLGCRAAGSLNSVMANDTGTRLLLARAMVLSGECAALPAQTAFQVLARADGNVRIRTARWGRLWATEKEEIPGLEGMDTARLRPDHSDAADDSGLSPEERREVEAELRTKPTVSGYGGRVQIGGESAVPGVRQAEAAAAGRQAVGGAVIVSMEGGMTRCQCANGQIVRTLRSGLDRCDGACGVQSSEGYREPTHESCYFHGVPVACEDSGRLKYHENSGTQILEAK